MPYRLLSFFLLAITLQACSAKHTASKSSSLALQQSQICCENYQDIHFQKLVKESSMSFNLDHTKQVYLFEEGKSFFEAIELPDYQSPYLIKLQSWGRDVDGKKLKLIVLPVMFFLDKHFQPLGKKTNLPFTYIKANEKDGIEASVYVAEKAKKLKYLVVYAAVDKFNKQIAVVEKQKVMPMVTGPTVNYVPLTRKKHNFRVSNEGSITISYRTATTK